MAHISEHVSKLSQWKVGLLKELSTISIVASEFLHSRMNFIHLHMQSLLLLFIIFDFNFSYSALVFHQFNLVLLTLQLVLNILQLTSKPLGDLLFLSYTHL